MTSSSRTPRRLDGKVAWAAVLFAGFLVSFFPIEESNDAWWHLKAGKLIFEGELGWYDLDPFTQSAQDRVWLNHEWLGEWLFYAAYALGGFGGAIVFKSFLVVATFGIVFSSSIFLARRTEQEKPELFPTIVAVLLATVCSQFTLYLRPPVYTFLLVALFHLTILKFRGGHPDLKTALAGAGLMALWANLHGGVLLGCVILFLMGVGSVIDWAVPKQAPEGNGLKKVRGWLLLGGGVAAGSLVNPYGYHLHLLTFEMMSHKWLTRNIPELDPPPFDLLWTLPLLLIPAAFGVARKGSWGERLVFLFLIWQGCSHVRHLPLLSIWAAPYAAAVLADLVRNVKPWQVMVMVFVPIVIAANKYLGWIPFDFIGNPAFRYTALAVCVGVSLALLRRPQVWAGFVVAAAVAIGFVLVYPGDRPSKFARALSGTFWSDKNYPDKLVDLIIEHDLEGPVILNRENYSGYIIWKLAPERMRTFTCSRFDLQGSIPRLELETLLWRHDEDWVEPDSGARISSFSNLWNEKYDFNLVLIEKRSDREDGTPFPLWTYLSDPASGYLAVAREGWPGKAFPDQEFTLFVRKGPELDKLLTRLPKRLSYER